MRRRAETVTQGKLRQSRQEAHIERELGHVAVCLIGYTKPVPRRFGDNGSGGRAVQFVTSAKPKASARAHDRGNPYHRVVVLESIWTLSSHHAQALKTKLDGLLLGNRADAKLRHGWREVDDPVVMWGVLLAQAVREIDAEVFDDHGHALRIRRVYERRARGIKGRG